jgi:hypothetical protein
VDNIQRLVAADAATTTTKPWELEVTSQRLKIVAVLAIIIVMGVHIFMASVVASGNTGAAVTTIDQWAFVGIGLIISAVCLTIMRPRVRANEDGVEIRNFIGTRFYPWDVIYGLSFPKGERWARLELPEFEFVPMWAFQSADGARVVTAVEQFRTLEDKYMPED